jgi:hypothetical protein
MSGEALNSTHSWGVDETAMEDWVRAVALTVPLRMPAQLLQLQFHCGKPPPAAEPKTMIFIDQTMNRRRKTKCGDHFHDRRNGTNAIEIASARFNDGQYTW